MALTAEQNTEVGFAVVTGLAKGEAATAATKVLKTCKRRILKYQLGSSVVLGPGSCSERQTVLYVHGHSVYRNPDARWRCSVAKYIASGFLTFEFDLTTCGLDSTLL